MSNMKSLLIGALIVAASVLGYLYYESQKNTVSIQLPSVKIQK